jgi:dolichol kinase
MPFITQNPKRLAGSSVMITAGVFMILVFGNFDHVPLEFVVVFLLAQCFGCWAHITSALEEKRLKTHANLTNHVPSTDGSLTK